MKKFYLILIFFLSLILIFYKFNEIPKNLDNDEVDFAKLTLSLEKKPYTPYSPQATGHPTLYFYIILLSFKIFGLSNFSLRFPSAFFGLLNPLLFYLILIIVLKKLKFKNYLLFSFIGAILFITSRWYFNFTRFSYEATFLLFLELLSIYFFLRWYLDKKNLWLILAAIFCGLAFNSYTPGRIFFLLPLSFLIYQSILLTKKNQNKSIAFKQLLYFIIPLIIIIAPLSIYFFNHKDIRFEQQFFLSNPQLKISQKIDFIFKNIQSNFLMIFLKGDINGRHNYPGKPALNPVLTFFFIVGFILSIKNYKNPFYLFSVLFFFLSIFPTILTYPWENPNMLRTITSIAPISFFSIVGFYNLLKFTKNKFKLKILNYLIFSLIFFSSIYEIRTYFKYQSKVFNEAFKIKNNLNKILKMNYE